MFTLDVPNDKIEKLKQILNKENVYNRAVGTSSDGLGITLKFKSQEHLDKASQLLASHLSDSKVSAQADLIRPSSIGSVSIGDEHIEWFADDGDPGQLGAFLSGDSFYDGNNAGVVLTENENATEGHVYWLRDYDYTRNIYVRATTYAGEGDGADGITIYLGTTEETIWDEDTDGIAVYIDEYNDDTIKVFKNGVLLEDIFYTGDTLDNATHRLFELVYEYISVSESYLHVLMNNTLVCRVPLDGFIPSGNFVGIGGHCVGLNNYHLCRSFAVMSGNPWLKVNR